ncbi:hypothetical protein CONLIGDRAFT_631197 [Coniochaeta ligniaria NRRL 30616]|uniref:Uncharacterized protein n=1 Tax=Coniochaeta ligniaria NRRL 30616 TaxID=1408157 RepID=A0A1J7IUC5_9PEZI|nr:hypothetical protein CONLIGDRAFT_631197 [Coniochaeta ligniaria NRRL 30616]
MPTKIMEQSHNLRDPATAPSRVELHQEPYTSTPSQSGASSNKSLTERPPVRESHSPPTQQRRRATSSSSSSSSQDANGEEDLLSESCVAM